MSYRDQPMQPIELTAGVQGDATYVGQREDGMFIVVTESALQQMSKADYFDAIHDISELWDKEWEWEGAELSK